MTVCRCGKTLKVFKNGREAKACGERCVCVDCGSSVRKGSDRCVSCRDKDKKKRLSLCVCQGCGRAYINKRHGTTGEGSRFCSRKCCFAYKRDNQKRIVVSRVHFNSCKQCGKKWVARIPSSLCSAVCRSEFARVDAMRRYIEEHAREVAMRRPVACIECGVEFVPTHGRVCCSSICSSRVAHRVTKGRDKARKHAVAYEAVNANRVFERDGWRCQICGKDTPKAARGTRRTNAPELDHRVPLSRGGTHTYANTQCSCRECNAWKNNKSNVGQLPLFNHVDGRGG